MATLKGTDVQYIGNNATGGMVLGASSTEKIGFYGATPIVRPTVTNTTTTTATAAALSTDLTALRVALRNLGLIG